MALDLIQIVRGLRYSGLELVVAERIVDAESMPNLDVTLATATPDQLVAMTLDVSQLMGLVIYCDQAITIETNNATTPDDTIAVAAGQCIIWTAADTTALCPLTVDVTALYVTVAGAVAPRLRCWFPLDPTV